MKILNLNKFRPRSDNIYTTEKKKFFFDVPQLVLLLMCVSRDRDRDRWKFKRLTGERDAILEGD